MAFADDTTGGRIILEGVGPQKVVLTAAAKPGDLLNKTGGLADGNATVPVPAKLVAGADGASGDTIVAYKAALVGGFSGGVGLGTKLYLSDTAGGYSETASTTSAQEVGIEVSATEAWVEPRPLEGEDDVVVVSGAIDATYDLDRYIFVADRRYRVKKVVIRASAIESTGAATTLMIEKVASGTAIGAGTDVLAAVVNLKTGVTVDTNATLGLHTTAANLVLAPGDALGLDFTNTVTEFVGVVTVTLERC